MMLLSRKEGELYRTQTLFDANNSGNQNFWSTKIAVGLALVLLLFGALEFFIPIRTTVQIGADEGFELAKVTLCLKGYKLYTDVWCDHPPLHTSLIAEAVKHLDSSVAGPRLVTIAFAALLIAAVFLIAFRLGSVLSATITALLLIASPGFLELSSSCMMEIPALAPAIAALCALFWSDKRSGYFASIIAGLLFGISLETKILGLLLFPAAALLFWTKYGFPLAVRLCLTMSTITVLTFVGLDLAIDRGAFLLNFHQSWMSHFAPNVSSEYGSPNEHRFPFTLLLKNWDMTVPAIFGVIWFVRSGWKAPNAIVPAAWLGLVVVVFATHRPWWTYYYVHIAIPLCLCAGFGLSHLFELALSYIRGVSALAIGSVKGGACKRFVKAFVTAKPALTFILAIALYALCSLFWVGSRAYLEISGIRESPQTYYSLVLNEIDRFKPFTKWIYTDNLTYSFYADIPVPPKLAVVSLKRLWSGEITVAGVGEEVRKFRPGLIALRNDTRELPFQDLLNTEYRLVYQDADNRLYAHRSIANNANTTARE